MRRMDFMTLIAEAEEMLFTSIGGCVCLNSPGLCDRCRSDKELLYSLGLWLSIQKNLFLFSNGGKK